MLPGSLERMGMWSAWRPVSLLVRTGPAKNYALFRLPFVRGCSKGRCSDYLDGDGVMASNCMTNYCSATGEVLHGLLPSSPSAVRQQALLR